MRLVNHDLLSDIGSTRADVVKTRLQTEAKTGQTHYKGMGDAFRKICEWLLGGHWAVIDVPRRGRF